MTKRLSIVHAFDNGGKTWDRYTIVIGYKGGYEGVAVYGMSCNAQAPNGFNQFAGELFELPAVLDALDGKEDKNIGQAVAIPDLPAEVRRAIGERLNKKNWDRMYC